MLSSEAFYSEIRVQILDVAVYVLPHNNILEKGKNQSALQELWMKSRVLGKCLILRRES